MKYTKELERHKDTKVKNERCGSREKRGEGKSKKKEKKGR